jgi:HEAT repeat protein
MGLFDFLKSKKSQDTSQQPAVDKNVARLARVTADKHAQNYDRMEAIQALAAMGTAESAAALLKRFTYYIEPSITDQEEKDVAFRGVLAAKHDAVEPILEACQRAESLTWPMKLLEEILPEDEYVEELLRLLERFDTEYLKNVEPKLQIVAALESKKRDDVRRAVEPFLEDVNETVRFHAVATVFAQDDEASAEPLCRALPEEESVRVKNRICEGLVARGWDVPQPVRAPFSAALPPGYALEGARLKRAR